MGQFKGNLQNKIYILSSKVFRAISYGSTIQLFIGAWQSVFMSELGMNEMVRMPHFTQMRPGANLIKLLILE